MHPRLLSLLQPMNVLPEVLCAFSGTVEDVLALRVGSVSATDPHAIQFHLDETDQAVAEVSHVRVDACFALAEAQSRMREIQRDYITRDDLKITQAERLYKADQDHRELEALLDKLKAVIQYCDSTEGLLRNKYFELSRKLKA